MHRRRRLPPRDARGRWLTKEEAKAARELSRDAESAHIFTAPPSKLPPRAHWRDGKFRKTKRTSLQPDLTPPTQTRKQALAKSHLFRSWKREILEPLPPKFPFEAVVYHWRFKGRNAPVRAEALIARMVVVNAEQSLEMPTRHGLRGRVVVRFKEGGVWGSKVMPLDELQGALADLSEAYEGEISSVDVAIYTRTPHLTERQPHFPRKPKPRRKPSPRKPKSAPRSTSKRGAGRPKKTKTASSSTPFRSRASSPRKTKRGIASGKNSSSQTRRTKPAPAKRAKAKRSLKRR